MSLEMQKCAEPESAGPGQHESQTDHCLLNAPECFILNLQWNGQPSPVDILRIMVAIPEKFSAFQLFK